MGKSFSTRFHSSFCGASAFLSTLRDASIVCCQVSFFTYRLEISRWPVASALDSSTILANTANTVSRNTLFVLFCPLIIFDSTLKGRNKMFTPFSFLSLPELQSFVVIIAESAGHFKCFLQTVVLISKLEAKVFYPAACCLIMVIVLEIRFCKNTIEL